MFYHQHTTAEAVLQGGGEGKSFIPRLKPGGIRTSFSVREIIRTKSSWVYVCAALFALLDALTQLPVFGWASFFLTVIALSLQGVEGAHAQKELDRRHTSVLRDIEEAREVTAAKHAEALQEIQQARQDAAHQHTEALKEIAQARQDAATQHGVALLEIKHARQEAARQYEEAERAIRKVEAERFLLQAQELAASLIQKDELVNKAVALYPDFRQSELKQLGIEMSQAVVGNIDYLQEKSLQSMRHHYETLLIQPRLDPGERTFFIEHAIRYLEETVVQAVDADAVALVYLACMYGCTQRYEDMMLVLAKARQASPIMQVIRNEYRVQAMLFLLVDACGSDQSKIDRLRETLALPQPTQDYFCTYMTQEYFLNPKSRANYSEWVVVRRPKGPGGEEKGSAILKVCAPYAPEGTGTVQ